MIFDHVKRKEDEKLEKRLDAQKVEVKGGGGGRKTGNAMGGLGYERSGNGGRRTENNINR